MCPSLSEYLEFVVDVASQAGQVTLEYFQTGVQVDLKDDQTPVTIADRKAEELIRRRIEVQYPRHAVWGEEGGEKAVAGATHRWFIDPIDGTKSFIRGVPLYAVLLGLEIEGQIEVGVAHFPALGETVAAASGEGCWWNGRRAWVSSVQSLSQALVAFTDVASFAAHNRAEQWERIKEATWHRAGWGDAYGHMLVATGRAELMLDPIMSPWDCGPFPAILREAGGYFGDWRGTVTIYANEAMSTSQALLPQVLALMDKG
jgi:myo-inositol-1(or 4)-monophosphatase